MKQGWRSLFFLTFPLVTLASFAPITTVRAQQIIPDNTLGAESSVVTPFNAQIDIIDGGATRGTNLFHSFQEFNIDAGRGGYFSNPTGIANILSRVTGGNPSNILGTLGVLGNANLFFINPNGIVFGPNASLDVSGSFLGSTANSLVFGNGFEFSASNPQAPPLLTVNIPIGLRFRENPGAIRVQGFGQQAGLGGASESFIFPTLEVRIGQNLALVGGNVSLEGGVLQAPGGRVEVGGLASPGDVEIQNDGLRFDVLGFPAGVQRADVFLTNQAGINVITDEFGGGSIDINARDINISGRSLLTAGFADSLGTVNFTGGDITLNATGETRIDQSRIENNVNRETIANNSNINITTGSFVLTNLAQLDASNFGSQSRFAGDITVNANGQITVDGGAGIVSDGFAGRVFLTSANNSVNLSNSFISTVSNNDNLGSDVSLIEITAPQGSISLNQATLSGTNFGSGFAGDISINARDRVAIVNQSTISSDGLAGSIFVSSERNSVDINNSFIGTITNDNIADDNFSEIFITAPQGSISLNQATLSGTNLGTGLAGDIRIIAGNQVSLNQSTVFSDGLAGSIFVSSANNSVDIRNSSIRTFTNDNIADDNFSRIFITAPQGSISLNQAELTSPNLGNGFAGDITINARDQVSLNQSTVFSNGSVGRVFLTSANNSVDISNSLISTDSNDDNTGSNFSLIDISALQGSISLNQATLSSTNIGTGFAGDITINARDLVSITSPNPFGPDGNGRIIQSNGNTGIISIGSETESPRVVELIGVSLSATNDNVPNTVTEPINAGNILIYAQDRIFLDQSFIETLSRRPGNAGNVTLQTNNGDIELAGNAGIFRAQEAGSVIYSTVEAGGEGNAGRINITTRNLTLRQGSELQTLVRDGQGDAGNINIQASGDVSFSGFSEVALATEDLRPVPSGIFSSVEAGGRGNAGNITITSQTGSVFLNNLAQLSSTNESNGLAGNIRINALNQVSLAQSSTIRSDGDIGRIFIGQSNVDAPSPIPSVISINNSTLSTTNSGTGLAGDIVLNARNEFSLTNQSIISSNGDFGRIFIGENTVFGASSSPRVVRIDNSTLSSTNSGVIDTEGTAINAGDVSIVAIDSISLNRSEINTFTEQFGNAGSVTLRSENGEISLADGSGIFSTVEQRGIGDGGDINITARTFSLAGGSRLLSSVSGEGDAGSISIQVSGPVLFAGLDFVGNQEPFPSGVFSRVEVGGIGNGGEITIRAGSLSLNDVSQIVTSTFGRGALGDVSNAGDISVQVDGSITLANLSTIRSSVEQGGVGIGGDINVRARSLTLTDGAEITAVVFRAENNQPGGTGRAGNIDINATDFVNISGVSSVELPFSFPTVGFSSGLATSAERGTTAIGPVAAGNITVTTGDFRLADGAVVNALTDNSGRGGDITINANTFTATGGGQVLATSFNSGRAGDITLNISDRITLSGVDPNFDQRFEQARIDQARVGGLATDIVNNQGSASGIFANTTSESTGQGGNLTINTRDLTVENGAIVTVSSPQAQAGNLTISARTIRLDRGSITAETAITGDELGANITLRDLELLSLLNGSLISARATGRTANGGNIIIDAARGFVVAFPRQNNDIIASASVGRGGNIRITSQGIFGLTVGRATPGNRTNDIDASSEFGLAGTVNRNTPEVDPSQGLVELPDDVTDPTDQIAQNPCQQGIGSEFIVTGRGGLPTSPNQTLSSDNVRVDLLEPVASTSNSASTSNIILPNTSPKVKQIVPAQGWIFNDKGEVVLTAYDPTRTGSQRSGLKSASCAAR